ncbi:MAG TPA: hypothetical protein VGQ99_06330 [Tepidisphaeraceae bacterium]|nr:hypothetical protein [Tepidisphaeraceae bacterium]
MAIIAIVALVVAAVGGWFLWKTLHPGPPLATAPTDKLVPFVIGPKFNELPMEKKALYLGALETREDELEKLFRAGKLSEPEMGMAREAAWLGKYVGRMNKFFALPPGQQRLDYIKKVVDKIQDVDEPPKTKGAPEDKLPKRDKKWGKQVVKAWPADVQAQWKEFEKAISDEEDRRKKEKKAAEKAGATKPATNPAKAGQG